MFSEPRVNVIKSSEGFTVEILSRGRLLTIRYCEGNHVLNVPAEMAGSAYAFVLLPSSALIWEEPHQDESIDDLVRERILNNIRAAYKFKGFEIMVACGKQ